MSRKKITKYIGIGAIAAIVLWNGGEAYRQVQLQQQLAEKVIRFHVVANSDTKEDQRLKLSVRDAIGGYMEVALEGMDEKADCRETIQRAIPRLEELAEQVIGEAGFDYEVNAELTRCCFPVKNYGDFTFPAGNYEALNVTIGKGEGANWWCVLYPNMCFENSVYEVVSEKSKQSLQKVLDREEYQAVLDGGNYEIRFRFLEWFR